MIMLWGLPGDTPLSTVREILASRGQAVAFVDQEAVLETDYEPTSEVGIGGILRVAGHVIELDRVTAAYLRPYGLEQLPGLRQLDRQGAEWRLALAVAEMLNAWTEMTPAICWRRKPVTINNYSPA